MDKREMLLIKVESERDYSKRQVLQSITTLRRILDNLEKKVNEDDVNADDGLQGNEWRLYKELSNLEQLNGFVKELEKLK